MVRAPQYEHCAITHPVGWERQLPPHTAAEGEPPQQHIEPTLAGDPAHRRIHPLPGTASSLHYQE